MHEYPRHIVTVGGVFRNAEGLVLLVRTKDKGWMFPGGQVEVGEDLMQALAREAKEESNCSIDVERLVGVYTNPQPSLERVMFLFSGRYADGNPQGDGDETLEAGFYTDEQVLELVSLRPSALKDQFLDAMHFDGRVTYRVYTTRPYKPLREWRL